MHPRSVKILDALFPMVILLIIGIIALNIDNKLAGYVALFAIAAELYLIFRTTTHILQDYEDEVLEDTRVNEDHYPHTRNWK
jgi:hypothetical protein